MSEMRTDPATDPGTDVEVEAVRGTRSHRLARRRWYQRPFVVLLAVTALAGGLRLYRVTFPPGYDFDEVYYAKDGCLDAGYNYKDCQLTSPNEQTVTVHPPLGRWLIAGSERLYGNRPLGWRFGSALFGTLSVFMLALIVYRLWRSVLWAGVAGLLLATENLNFVESRIAMLDIYVAGLVVAGFLFLVLDRQWIERRTPKPDRPSRGDEALLLDMPPDRPPSPILRPWRIATGIALGAATSVKWSGGAALFGALLLSIFWERSRRKEIGLPAPLRETLRDESFGIFVFLMVLPLGVYLASYVKWFADHQWSLSQWWKLQRGMANFSIHLRSPHPYSSPAWTWIFMKRPVAYYYVGDAAKKTAAEILGMGNPLVFWGAVLTVPYALFAWIWRRDWRAGFAFVTFSCQYFPWFFAARTNFLFYMTPITPFMVLAIVYALRDLSEVRIGVERARALAPLSGLFIFACVVSFVFFLPILTGRTIGQDAWRARMWFGSWI
jgi:dolichyl-phosphate-mannose-protein mannosyltransferase